jgi:Phage tail tube protein, TTP
MSTSLGVGTQVAIASGFEAADVVSAVSNAGEAVCTVSVGHGLIDGDIVEVTSGWPLLNGRIARIKASGATSVTLEGIDTSSTTLYPAGEGAGSLRKVTGFTSIPLIADPTLSGGEQQYVDVPELAKPRTGKLPSEISAIDISFPVYFEATPSAGVTRVVAVAATGTPAALRLTHPSGDKIYANGNWSIRRMPNISRAAARQSLVSFAQLAVEETIYAS